MGNSPLKKYSASTIFDHVMSWSGGMAAEICVIFFMARVV